MSYDAEATFMGNWCRFELEEIILLEHKQTEKNKTPIDTISASHTHTACEGLVFEHIAYHMYRHVCTVHK